jgi:hypothetical protein
MAGCGVGETWRPKHWDGGELLIYDGGGFVGDSRGNEMARKITRSRPWTKEEIRMLKTLAREKTKTTLIARKLKRSVAAVYLRASKLAVMLGGGRGRKRA